MKKTYIAPLVLAESFQLSHHIAACSGTIVKMNQTDMGDCGGTIHDEDDPLNGLTIFAADGFCGKIHDDEYIDAEGYCYTKQDNAVGFFGS